MSHYAQHRRRGGSPPGPAAAPATTSIVSFNPDGGDPPRINWVINWSAPTTVDDGVAPDGNLFVDTSGGITAINIVGPFQTAITFVDPVDVGAAWSMAAQPNWLVTPAGLPESGTV